ncbi:hypothetical protein PS2_046229 [Malus domestica]
MITVGDSSRHHETLFRAVRGDPEGRCHHRHVHSKIKKLWFFPLNIHSPACSARLDSETDPQFPQCCYLSSQLLQANLIHIRKPMDLSTDVKKIAPVAASD